jgi:pyruvate dehydrogenase (quinone)
MVDTVANFSIDASPKGGVCRIYGYPGDGINGITAALLRHDGPNDLAALRAAVEEAAR